MPGSKPYEATSQVGFKMKSYILVTSAPSLLLRRPWILTLGQLVTLHCPDVRVCLHTEVSVFDVTTWENIKNLLLNKTTRETLYANLALNSKDVYFISSCDYCVSN